MNAVCLGFKFTSYNQIPLSEDDVEVYDDVFICGCKVDGDANSDSDGDGDDGVGDGDGD